MRLLYSLSIAISMYSKIPVPMVDWNEKNMKYAMCFFPVVGVITGLLQAGAGYLILQYTSFGMLFFAGGVALIPVLVTGGIHLEGYADTIDALSSYGDREKKLQILKDPHTGAFAVIGLCVYFAAVLALWSEADVRMLPLTACIYPFSRSLSGISVVSFQAAKNSGLLRTFQDGAQKKRVRIVLIICALVCGSHAVSWLEPEKRFRGCGGARDCGGSSGICLLLQDEQKEVRRNDRRSGGVFPAGV